MAPTSDITSKDQSLWKDIKTSTYSIVLAAPKILFDLHSQFGLSTICNKSNAFYYQLTYVAINEYHLIRVWRKFHTQYSNMGFLYIVFSKVPIMAMSAIFTLNIFKDVRKILNLKPLVQLYYRLLDCSNITYIVIQINFMSKFWNLSFFIPDIGSTNAIKKTMIFVDNIFKDINMAKYLKFLLFIKL